MSDNNTDHIGTTGDLDNTTTPATPHTSVSGSDATSGSGDYQQPPVLVGPPTEPPYLTPPRTTPDIVDLAVKVWWVALAVEVLHQLISAMINISGRGELASRVRPIGSQPLPDAATLETLSAVSAVFIAVIALAIVGFFAVLVRQYRAGGKWASVSRRTLSFLGIYFGFRGLLVFVTEPVVSVSTGLIAVDGSARIIVGVAAVMAVFFSTRSDSLEWTGESNDSPQDRQPPRFPRLKK